MISTHILDTSLGQPAKDVLVRLEKQNGSLWEFLGEEKTNHDGRISFQCAPEVGVYRLLFKIEEYFLRSKTKAFFVEAPVIFRVQETNRKYHVPLLLNPFGYSTYRGS